MSRKRFGTDGIRGVANQGLTPEQAFLVGQAAARYCTEVGWTRRVVIGGDTRKSGPMLEAALAAGFCSAGMDVVSLGVAPTGCISYVARHGDYGMGAVVSASHNPAPDNGIKLIGHDGRKLPDDTERRIEELMDDAYEKRPIGAEIGSYLHNRAEIAAYMTFLETLVPERLDGMKIAVDASNGAGFELGPDILHRLGARVIVSHATPDGMNINAGCGATHPTTIQELTVHSGADLGVAFDGDADRAVFSDSQGRLINGDRTMGIWAAHWGGQGELNPAVVVGTVMSNSGFEEYLAGKGIELQRVQVGDKYVAQRLQDTGGRVGGEQSGHLIFSERGVTGDGLITALELIRVIKREARPSASFFEDFQNWPQLLVNVSVASRDALKDSLLIEQAVSEASALVGEKGRVNVRPSGTQPMVRVMVEAKEEGLRDKAAARIVSLLETEFGGTIYSRTDLTYALGD